MECRDISKGGARDDEMTWTSLQQSVSVLDAVCVMGRGEERGARSRGCSLSGPRLHPPPVTR